MGTRCFHEDGDHDVLSEDSPEGDVDPLAMGAEETESRDVVMGREWWSEEGVKAELPLRQDATDRAATTLDDNFIV